MRFFIALAKCDAAFGSWYERGKSAKGRKRQIDVENIACLLELLERGRNRRDVGDEVIEELGFHVGMWNGAKEDAMVGVDATCGLYSTVPGLGGNCVLIDLPADLGELSLSERMANVVVAVATSWEPDWAGVFSVDAMNSRSFSPAVPFVDWILYLSHSVAPNVRVPAPFSVNAVDGIGSLVMIEQDAVGDDVAHLQRVKAIETALGIVR